MSRSPTSLSHVSCCNTHPPYTRLSRFFARLVRRRLLSPELLKRLLYLQYIFKPDLSSVKMRKCCLVSYSLLPNRRSLCSSDSPIRSPAEPPPARKSSTLRLEVRYALDEPPPAPVAGSSLQPEQQPRGPASLAGPASLYPGLPVEPAASRSLPAVMSSGSCCILPSFDALPYREAELAPALDDLSRLSAEDSKNWRSLGRPVEPSPQQPQPATSPGRLRRAECEPSLPAVAAAAAAPSLTTAAASPRSSDSGMADSFQYHSAEIGSGYADKYCRQTSAARHSESENDENKFENQCICTSPFGSTPRHSTSSDSSPKSLLLSSCQRLLDDTRLVDPSDDDEDDESKAHQAAAVDDSSGDEDLEHCTCRLQTTGRREEVEQEKSFAKMSLAQQRHMSQPLPYDRTLRPRRPKRPLAHRVLRPTEEESTPDASADGQVFTSGLYAHWWLKKTIPLTDQAEQPELEDAINGDDGGTVLATRD